MKNKAWFLAAVFVLGVLAVAGCASRESVTGTVTYRERIALPENGVVVNVQLQDVSRADAPAVVIGEQVIEDPGHQVPIPFEIEYDPDDIDERFSYAVLATIRVDGNLMFTTATRYGVITRDNPTEVELVLEKVSGQVESGDLEDVVWALESYGDPAGLTPVLADTEVTVEFKSGDGQMGGSAGCNRYFGAYELAGSQLTVPGPMGSTAMACLEPLMEQEQEYLRLLQSAQSYSIDGDRLSVDCGGQVLVFRLQPPEETKTAPAVAFTFDDGTEGWVGGFADLPVDHADHGYDVDFSYGDTPVSGEENKGLLLTGNNHSDDLFMYIARKFDSSDGLTPGAAYTVDLSFNMATNAAPGMMGIGGSPGESVYIKAGVVDTEPQSEPGTGDSARYVLNLDKANQSQSGEDMVVVGDAAKSEGDGQDDDSYQYKAFSHTFEAVANESGELWVIIGSDSGFEGTSLLYYDDIGVSFAVSATGG